MDDIVSWEFSAKRDFEINDDLLTLRFAHIGERVVNEGDAPYQNLDMGSLRANSVTGEIKIQTGNLSIGGEVFANDKGEHYKPKVSYDFDFGKLDAKASLHFDCPIGEPYYPYNSPTRVVAGLKFEW